MNGVPDPEWMRLMAVELDTYAAELDRCAGAELEPGVEALSAALIGAATPRLQDDYRQAIRAVRMAAGLLRDGAAWARSEAEALDAAQETETKADGGSATEDDTAPDPVFAF